MTPLVQDGPALIDILVRSKWPEKQSTHSLRQRLFDPQKNRQSPLFCQNRDFCCATQTYGQSCSRYCKKQKHHNRSAHTILPLFEKDLLQPLETFLVLFSLKCLE